MSRDEDLSGGGNTPLCPPQRLQQRRLRVLEPHRPQFPQALLENAVCAARRRSPHLATFPLPSPHWGLVARAPYLCLHVNGVPCIYEGAAAAAATTTIAAAVMASRSFKARPRALPRAVGGSVVL